MHNLVDLLHTLYETADKPGSYSRVVLLDFAKAFDHIDHAILLEKFKDLPPHLFAWMRAFLCERRQRVKLGNTTSTWMHVKGGVPQGTVVGPRAFIVMINDLSTSVKHYKYVDDTTLIEQCDHLNQPNSNNLQLACKQAASWASPNLMNFNVSKTKLMDVCFLNNKVQFPDITIAGEKIEKVYSVKLLGIQISNNLKWDDHINSIYVKAAKRIYQLRLLKRAGASTSTLVNVFKACVRPVMEYACPAWHTNISCAHSVLLESIQKRAMRIVYPDLDYTSALELAKLPTLQNRREELCKTFFKTIMNPSCKIHDLLPAARDSKYALRSQTKYELPKCRTERFKRSLLPHCLYNFQ